MVQQNKSAEDYLETIFVLKNRLGMVRSVDIVNYTGYKKSSISVAMKKLRERGDIEMNADGFITLTEGGSAAARKIYSRHCFLVDFFTSIGVEPETAAEDACKIEHELSEETFARMKKYFGENK